MFEICRLGDNCVINTLQTKCCATEYGFCVEFVTCVQCGLQSHVSTQCGDRRIEELHALPSQTFTLTLPGSFVNAHMVSALKAEFAQAHCYFM